MSPLQSPTIGVQFILALVCFIAAASYFIVGDTPAAIMWFTLSAIVLGAPMLFAMFG